MSTTAMLLVLVAAMLHAGWNAIIRSSSDRRLDAVLVAAGTGVVGVAGLPFLPAVAGGCLPFIGASAIVHTIYMALVGAVYARGEMSYAYPLMRGSAPMIVALASATIIGEHLSPIGWGAVALTCGGVLCMTLAGRGLRAATPERARTTAFTLVTAGVIATYTLVDGLGVRASAAPAAYTLWVFALSAPPIVGWALLRRRAAFAAHCRSRWPQGLAGGGASVGAYALVLSAMTHAPVAMVAALRETAILFGLAISAAILKERFGWTRHLAALAIMAGAILLRFG